MLIFFLLTILVLCHYNLSMMASYPNGFKTAKNYTYNRGTVIHNKKDRVEPGQSTELYRQGTIFRKPNHFATGVNFQ